MAKEILGFRIESLRVPAVREFLHSVNEAVENCTTITTRMPLAYPQWRAAFEEMNRVYEISLKSEDTALIRNLDERRDMLKTSIKTAADSYRRAMDDDTRRRGTAIWDAFGSFRVDNNAQYNIETAQLDSLLAVLLAEPLRADVEALGLLPLVEQLKSLNDRLHELVGIRDLENIAKPDGQRQEVMAAAVAAYRRLAKYINAYSIISVEAAGAADEALSLCIDLINSIILRYRRSFSVGSTSGTEEETEAEEAEGNGADDNTGTEGDDENNENTGGNTGDNNNTGGGGNNQTPGGGTGSDQNGSEGGETYTIAWFDNHGQPLAYYQLPVGATVPEAPAPPAGYRWPSYPTTMPARDVDVVPVAI